MRRHRADCGYVDSVDMKCNEVQESRATYARHIVATRRRYGISCQTLLYLTK